MRIESGPGRQRPLLLAVSIAAGATALVFYLHYDAVTDLKLEAQRIVQQISQQAAEDIAAELRQSLDGPTFDTLSGVDQEDLRASRLDLLGEHFAKGLDAYPHVERFFQWSGPTAIAPSDEVLFFGRNGRFFRDAPLGQAIFDLVDRYAPSQPVYVAAEGVGPEHHHDVFLRLFWTEAQRLTYFGVLGFVVEPTYLRQQLFVGARGLRFKELLARNAGGLPLQFRVKDEDGEVVYGRLAGGPAAGRVEFPMLFYPADEVQSRLAVGVAPKLWAIEVDTPEVGGAFAGVSTQVWPMALSAMLIFIGLGLTVQAHRRSSELARMQTDFVAHVTHQLKTPLSLLSAATETLQMDRIRSPEKLASYLDTIHAEAARLSALVQRVLEFSRMHQRSYEFEQLDLGALATETVDAFAYGLPGRRFVCDAGQDNRGLWVHADSAALEQVVANLLDNAVKYSEADSVVTVRARTDGASAVVEVSDEGVGIAASDRARIFDRFYRASGAGHRPGFGLGLAIVQELVRVHGGRVEVASAPGKGSTFRVVLPRAGEELNKTAHAWHSPRVQEEGERKAVRP